MIEIRLVKDYDKGQLKFILDKIKEVAPRELTYSLEAGRGAGADVNIREKSLATPVNDFKGLSINSRNVLWVIIFQVGYITYYQGESYSGESLDEIIYDMFDEIIYDTFE